MPADKFDEAQIRRLIVAEVAAQLKPFKGLLQELSEAVKTLHDWQLSFWSNGSKDRPIGFFQHRMQEDDRRNAQIKEDLQTQADIAGRLDKYIASEITRREYREKQLNRLWPVVKWVGGGIGACILGLAAWLGPHIIHVADILWEDYLQAHPAVTQKLKNDADNQPQQPYNPNQQQESKVPPLVPKR